MKTVSILLCALFVFASTFAQEFQLSGNVTNSKNEPIEGVSIFIKGTTTGTETNALGNYNFSLEKEQYTIVVSYVGMITQEQTINLEEDVTANFVLLEDSEILDEVLVRSVRVTADSPITYSNISKEEIEDRNLGQDIPILLNYQPAVVTTSDAGAGVGYTGIRVRGSDATRVNVTINGIPYNDAESQGTFWVNLGDFASSTENIQLQRGVGTSVNGSGAFGASLNILTDAVKDEAYGELSGSIGSFNTRKATLRFGTGTLSDHFSVSGRLSKIDSDGYIDRATSDLKGYFLQAAYKDDNTLIKAITFGGFEETYQAYYGVDEATLQSDRTFNTVGQQFDREGNFEGFYENEVDNYRQDHYQFHQRSVNQGLPSLYHIE
ncbi:TonB-dependent receptor [Croceibacter atlanticus]|uniref:TonB-dependent receptor n=1 Tax=Croceibacter atlanticus TaxID=313588 RepID=UPI002491F625|nr:TonB-dependent receptor [Croceibacter atlanticus]